VAFLEYLKLIGWNLWYFGFCANKREKKNNFKHILNFHDTLYFCILQGAQCQQKWSFCCCLFNYLSFTLLPHF
jgi:hypothetical protein